MDDKTVSLPLGDDFIKLRIRKQNGRELCFLNVHDNENTSVEAAVQIIEQRGGRLLELVHSGQRLMEFSLNGRGHRVDPNRIFSRAGIQNSLRPHTDSAENAVAAFAENLWTQYLARLPLVLTVHNNTDGHYSIDSYEIGKNAIDVHIESGMDRDDFLVVTARRLFEHFKSCAVSVAHEDVSGVDDGSLSVFCGRVGKPYINVEAQHGRLATQVRLLALVAEFAERHSGGG